MSSNDLQARLERFRQMAARFPDRSVPHFSLAQALQESGDLAGADAAYAEACRLQPDFMLAYLQHAACLVELGARDRARIAAEKARDLAVAQKHSGPLADAEELLEDLEDVR